MASSPFLSEIKIFSFNFPPKGYAFCNGQFLPINQNQALFSLLGTTYGGNGQTTFALPDLRGRTPVHMGGSHSLGQRGGEEAHTLIMSELAAHTHTMIVSGNAPNKNVPLNNYPASNTGFGPYGTAPDGALMAPGNTTDIGGNQPHENRSPFIALNYCIALQGVFPSQT